MRKKSPHLLQVMMLFLLAFVLNACQFKFEIMSDLASVVAPDGTVPPPDSSTLPSTNERILPVDLGAEAAQTNFGLIRFQNGYDARKQKLFISNTQAGFYSLDVQNPSSVTKISGFTSVGGTFMTIAAGNYAYLSHPTTNQISIVDITDLSAPALLSTLAVGQGPTYMTLSGSNLFVSNKSSNSVSVVNVSTPAAPTVTATVSVGTAPADLETWGSVLYVLNSGSNTITRINTTGWGVLGTHSTAPTLKKPTTLVIYETRFAASSNTEMRIVIGHAGNADGTEAGISSFNTTSLTSATEVTSSYGEMIYNQGKYIYGASVSGKKAGVFTYNINTDTLTSVSEIALNEAIGDISSVFALGEKLYVSNSKSIEIVDISAVSVGDLIQVATIRANENGTPSGSSFNSRPVFIGNMMYIGAQSGRGLYAYDITTPSAPVYRGAVALSGNADLLAVKGADKIVVGHNNSLSIVDISDPAAMSVLGNVGGLGNMSGIVVKGNYAYVTQGGGDDKLTVVDLTTASSPAIGSAVVLGNNPLSPVLNGNYIYAINDGWPYAISVVNITTAASPTVSSTVSSWSASWTPSASNGGTLSISGTKMIIGFNGGNWGWGSDPWSSGAGLFDISNPATPTPVSFQRHFTGYNSEASGSYGLLQHAYLGGIQVVDFTDPANPVWATSWRTSLLKNFSGGGSDKMAVHQGHVYYIQIGVNIVDLGGYQ